MAALDKVYEEFPHALPTRAHERAKIISEIRARLDDSPEGRRADAVEEEGGKRESDAFVRLLTTVPTTIAGCLALIDFVADQQRGGTVLWVEGENGEPGTDLLLATLAAALRRPMA